MYSYICLNLHHQPNSFQMLHLTDLTFKSISYSTPTLTIENAFNHPSSTFKSVDEPGLLPTSVYSPLNATCTRAPRHHTLTYKYIYIYICNIIYTGHIFLPIGISCLYRNHLVLIEPGYCISYALDENIERPISGPCAATRFQLPLIQQDKVQEPGSLDSKTTFPTSFSNSTDGTGSSRYHKILHAGYPYRTWMA